METVETLTYGPLDSLGARVALYLLVVYPLVCVLLLITLRRNPSEKSVLRRWLAAAPTLCVMCALVVGSALCVGLREYYNHIERQIRWRVANDLLSRIEADGLWGVREIRYMTVVDVSSGYFLFVVRCVRHGNYETMLVTAKTEPDMDIFLPIVLPLESVETLRIELLDVAESESFGEWVREPSEDGCVEALPGGSGAIPSALEPREPTANRGR